MSRIDPCKQKCDIITFSENKMSTKMLKAMMLKMGGGKISYHNSRTKSTHRTIISLNYIDNRLLLLRYKYKLYFHYVKSLSSINKDLYFKVLQMLDILIAQLTPDERNIVFDTIPPEEPIEETFEDSGVVFNIVSKRIVQFSYFIITNIKTNYVFETGLFYTFDLSDPTNIGTRFCLSLNKDGVAYDCRYNSTPPGQPGSTMKLYVSKFIPLSQLYVFNLDEESKGNQYEQWGYSNESIFVNRDKITIDDTLGYTFRTFDTSHLKFVIYEWYGPKILIDPFFSSDPTKSSNPVYLYKNNFIYKLGIGVYYIYLHNYYSLAFLNRNKNMVGISSPYNRGTKPLDHLFLAGSGLSGDYTFYSGMIRLTILGPFDPISLYNDRYGYMGGLFMIQYGDSNLKNAIPDEFISTNTGSRYGLDSQTIVDATRFTFQKIPYNSINTFALAKGVYTIYNTTNLPITLINTNKTEWITIKGVSKKIETKVLVDDKGVSKNIEFLVDDIVLDIGPQGEECIFYYGTVVIRVLGDFGKCSLYTPRKGSSDGGYRGGHGLLVYDEAFSNTASYIGQDMNVPAIVSNNTVCPVILEVFKPISSVSLSLSEYTLTLGDVFVGTVKYGDSTIHEMRYKLTPKIYTFLFNGKVTIYGTNAVSNTQTNDILNYRTIILTEFVTLKYPIYTPPPGRTTSAFTVKDSASEDFCIVHEVGNSKYTYFMTYS